MDVLRCDQLKQSHASMGSAVAAVFDATPGSLRDAMRVNDLVDHYSSGLNAFRNSPSPGDVLCPDTCGQTIDTVICQLYGFVIGAKGHHRQHWSKSFISHYCHVVI